MISQFPLFQQALPCVARCLNNVTKPNFCSLCASFSVTASTFSHEFTQASAALSTLRSRWKKSAPCGHKMVAGWHQSQLFTTYTGTGHRKYRPRLLLPGSWPGNGAVVSGAGELARPSTLQSRELGCPARPPDCDPGAGMTQESLTTRRGITKVLPLSGNGCGE